MDINTKLKKLLEDSGQRQAEVAQKCGLTPANLSRALTRDHNLNLSTALKIADGIGLELRIEDADGTATRRPTRRSSRKPRLKRR